MLNLPGFSLCWVEKLEHCKPPLTSWSCSILHPACWVEIQPLNEFHSLFAKPLCCCGSAGLCGCASCNVGPHLSFSKAVITDSHVDISALMSPQLTDRVLKTVFLNRDMSKPVPGCRKKTNPKLQLTQLAVFLTRSVFLFTEFQVKWNSCALDTEFQPWWIVSLATGCFFCCKGSESSLCS